MPSNCYFLSVEPFRPLVQKLVGPLSCRGMNEFFYVIDRLGLVGRERLVIFFLYITKKIEKILQGPISASSSMPPKPNSAEKIM
jgi:hypothetical protein